MRIMVVDDEPIIRMDLREMLEEHNCLVVAEASDGKTAINMARSVRPDLALMDIKMPGEINGLTASKVIIDEDICPVVLLTAYNQRELIEEAAQVGVYGYLVKPIKEDEVYPTLSVALAKWWKMRQLMKENGSLKNKLEKRKAIDIAKGILMEKYDMKEREAYRKIQKLSMEKRQDMLEISRSIIISNELIHL